MKEECCIVCGRVLTPDEIGMSKKAVNRGARDYYCLDCLAEHFGVSRAYFEEKIRLLREMGCTLFPR